MTADVLAQVVSEVLRDPAAHQQAEEGLPPLWGLVRELGWPRVGIDESDGGEGGSLADLCTIVRRLGGHPVPVPLAEAALGHWVAARAGLGAQAAGAVPVVALPRRGEQPQHHRGGIDGTITRVPWASRAERLLVLAGDTTCVVDPAAPGVVITPGANLAHEPRETVRLSGASPDARALGPDAEQVRLRAALLRSAGTVGALERVATLTVAHVDTRTQFGRPLRAFQAVGHAVATIACEQEVAAVALAAALPEPLDATRVAAARVVIGRAATTVSRCAHQLHGAIGITREHELHRYTGRLLAWRDEVGTQREWARRLGAELCQAGSVGIWQWLTSRQGGR